MIDQFRFRLLKLIINNLIIVSIIVLMVIMLFEMVEMVEMLVVMVTILENWGIKVINQEIVIVQNIIMISTITIIIIITITIIKIYHSNKTITIKHYSNINYKLYIK